MICKLHMRPVPFFFFFGSLEKHALHQKCNMRLFFENVGQGSYTVCLHLHAWLLTHMIFIMHVRVRAQRVENGVFRLGCIIHFAFAKCTCLLVCPGRANECRWNVRLLSPLIGSIQTKAWPLQQMSLRLPEACTKTHTHTKLFSKWFSFWSQCLTTISIFSPVCIGKTTPQLLEVLNTKTLLLGVSTQQELRTFLLLKRIWLDKFNRMQSDPIQQDPQVIKFYNARNA